MKTDINMCKKIKIKNISDERGSLCVVESNLNINFVIKRVYYIHQVPKGFKRGSHAHKNLHQFFIALSGEFDLKVNDGSSEKIIHMNNPSEGVYLPPMIWRELENFSNTAICFVLASENYQKSDYIFDFEEFKKSK